MYRHFKIFNILFVKKVALGTFCGICLYSISFEHIQNIEKAQKQQMIPDYLYIFASPTSISHLNMSQWQGIVAPWDTKSTTPSDQIQHMLSWIRQGNFGLIKQIDCYV